MSKKNQCGKNCAKKNESPHTFSSTFRCIFVLFHTHTRTFKKWTYQIELVNKCERFTLSNYTNVCVYHNQQHHHHHQASTKVYYDARNPSSNPGSDAYYYYYCTVFHWNEFISPLLSTLSNKYTQIHTVNKPNFWHQKTRNAPNFKQHNHHKMEGNK